MTLFSDEDRKRIFFFTDEDAKYYDLVEELTQPCIGLIHDTMIDLVEYSLGSKRAEAREQQLVVLDPGSGTGAEAFRLLARFDNIHIVAIDFSPAMNQEFRRKFLKRYPRLDFPTKVTLLEEDVFGTTCAPDELIEHLPGLASRDGYDAAVAGFFLHHYSAEQKREFYQRMYESLRPGGVLIHGDLFGFQSRALTRYAHDFGERWIRKQLSNPDAHLREKQGELGAHADRLCREWVAHWNCTHVYHPAERPYPESAVDSGYPCADHESMIRAAGFREIACPFRLWEAGVIWARR